MLFGRSRDSYYYNNWNNNMERKGKSNYNFSYNDDNYRDYVVKFDVCK